MARMSIDDSVLRDPRVALLARDLGWSRRETLGALLDVWAVAYDRATGVVSQAEIDEAAGKQSFSIAMAKVGLGVLMGDDLLIKGATERVEYLNHRRKAGAAGGRKSGESRRNHDEAKPRFASAGAQAPVEARGNPIPNTPDSPNPNPVVDPNRGPGRPTTCPSDWEPDESPATLKAESAAAARGLSLADQLERMKDWSAAGGTKGRKADWDATWRNWLKNARTPAPWDKPSTAPKTYSTLKPGDDPDAPTLNPAFLELSPT